MTRCWENMRSASMRRSRPRPEFTICDLRYTRGHSFEQSWNNAAFLQHRRCEIFVETGIQLESSSIGAAYGAFNFHGPFPCLRCPAYAAPTELDNYIPRRTTKITLL